MKNTCGFDASLSAVCCAYLDSDRVKISEAFKNKHSRHFIDMVKLVCNGKTNIQAIYQERAIIISRKMSALQRINDDVTKMEIYDCKYKIYLVVY